MCNTTRGGGTGGAGGGEGQRQATVKETSAEKSETASTACVEGWEGVKGLTLRPWVRVNRLIRRGADGEIYRHNKRVSSEYSAYLGLGLG